MNNYDTNKFVLMHRNRLLRNTDPQRRCYNGAHFSSELVWSDWSVLDRLPTLELAQRKLKFWTELNDYAVSSRGESARSEFKIEELK